MCCSLLRMVAALYNVDSGHIFTSWFLSSELCFRTCCNSAEYKQCRQAHVELLFNDFCNCEKKALNGQQAMRGV